MAEPTFHALDLSKGHESDHPDIKEDQQYLCRIDGKWFAGTFSRQWFGWSFDDWHGGPLQFDTPGTNGSDWEQIMEIREA